MSVKSEGCPRVSVIVPAYNAGDSLPRCINSILSQTESNIELILINDGSSQVDSEYCRCIASEDERVRLIEQENRGISAARNIGIEAARGDYIGFVDSDDEITPDMIGTLLGELDHSGCRIAVCGVTVSGIGGILGRVDDGYMTARDILSRMDTPDGWEYIIACNKLYSRELFDDKRFPDGKIHEDEFLIPQIIVKAGGAVCLSRCCYIYYLHKGSTSQTMSIGRFDYIEALTSQLELVRSENLDNICEGIVNREMYAYLWMLSSELVLDKDNLNTLLTLHGNFLKAAKGCKLSFVFRIKTVAVKLAPRIYHKIDAMFLRMRNYRKEIDL